MELEENEIIDNKEGSRDGVLSIAIAWWEKKRITFNIAVGISGIGGILVSGGPFYRLDLIGVVFWGLFANLLYCVGLLIELFDAHYFNSRFNLSQYRMTLFGLGTAATCFVTFVFAFIYFQWIQF